jgi:hypothetical protein
MITFYEQQNKIEKYLKENYEEYLSEYNIKEPVITTDFLDLDKHKSDFTLFIEYSRLEFPVTQWSDDCEHIEKLQLKIYLVFRNNTPDNLQKNMLNAAFAFYKMFRSNPGFNISNETLITGINFYNYVEANKYIVASEIGLTMEISI